MHPKQKQTEIRKPLASQNGYATRLLPSHSRPSSEVPPQPRYGRRVDDLVEQSSSPNEQRETDDLQPLEGLPAQSQRDEPDEERAAGVDCAAGGGADLTGDGEPEEVETAG